MKIEIKNETTLNQTLGALVKKYRDKKELTQKNVADQIGLSSTRLIHLWESGKKSFPIPRLKEICLMVDLPIKKVRSLIVNQLELSVRTSLGEIPIRHGRRKAS